MNRILIFVSLVLACGIRGSAQSGWTQAKSQGFYKLSQDIMRASSFYNPDGDIIDITTTSVYSTNIYAEYGISDRLTAILNTPLFVRSTINNRESTVDGVVVPGDVFNGFGDIQIGAKYGIVHGGSTVMAASGTFKFPTGESVGGESELLQSGDGAWGFTALVHGSHSFYPTPVYASLYGGFQWRGETELDYSLGTEVVDYDDAVRWGLELGWTADDSWTIILKANHVIALDNGTGGGLTGGSSIFGNSISFFALTPEVSYLLDNGLGFSLSMSAALAAENILAAPNFNVGVVYVAR